MILEVVLHPQNYLHLLIYFTEWHVCSCCIFTLTVPAQSLNTALWSNSDEKYPCQPEELRAAASTAASLVNSPEPQPFVLEPS